VAHCRVEAQVGNQTLFLETGKLAKQAHGAVVVGLGDSQVLVTACEGPEIPGKDFFPLVVDYREKTYAAGKFPGGFIKREGRPTTKEILTARLIDRPIRPLFPANYVQEVQIMCSTLSFDRENDPDVLCMIGSSAALNVSHIPFLQLTAAVRIGRVNGELVVMPTISQMEESDLDLIVSGTREAVTMIEGFAREMPEEEMATAIVLAQREIRKIIDLIEALREKAGLGRKELPPPPPENPLKQIFQQRFSNELRTVKQTSGKKARADAVRGLREKIYNEFIPEDGSGTHEPGLVAQAFGWLEEKVVRDLILEGTRIDGRNHRQIRALAAHLG